MRLYSNTASYNTAVGYKAGYSNTTGTNDAFGTFALLQNTTGTQNVAIGKNSLENNTTASDNTAVGYQAGYSNTTGENNVFVGEQAGYANTTAGFNAYYGEWSGRNTTSEKNTFIGQQSGYSITTGSKNTILGRYNGNLGGLDIRTANNQIVLSDGDGNPRVYVNSGGSVFFGGSSTSGTSLSYISTTGSMDMRSSSQNATSTRFRWHSPQFNSGGQTKHGIQLFNGDSDNLQLGFISDANGNQGSLIDTSNTDLGIIIRSNYNGVRLSNGSTSWSSYSDSRLKTVTGEIPNALDKIDAMRGVLFSWNNDEDNTQRCGVIAQEVQAVLPEVVDDDTDYLQVRYTELVPLLIQGIKEQKATIETLEARITTLEG